MDSPRVALGSPACDAGVFLLDDEPILSPKVHASDLSARHAPKDLNPDQLGWNQSCYRYTRDTHLIISGSRETRTHKSRSRPPVFKTGSSSGRMTSVCKLRELESNQRPPGSEPGVTTNSNYPASFMFKTLDVRTVRVKLRGQESNLRTRGSKPGISTDRNYPAIKQPEGRAGLEPTPWYLTGTCSAAELPTQISECPAGVEPASPGWKPGAFAARPRAHVVKRKGRESNPQGSSKLVPVRAGCHRQLACPSVRLRRQESNLRQRRLTAAFPYQHRTHRIKSLSVTRTSQDGRI